MTQRLANMRILVADDQMDVARTLCRPLHKEGARLRFAADGHTALQEIDTHPFDLLLIDMKMPPEEWGGLWLLRQLKERKCRIPNLVLSGEGSKQQVIEALRLDAVDWVVKGTAGEELLDRCAATVADRLGESLELATHRLPTPWLSALPSMPEPPIRTRRSARACIRWSRYCASPPFWGSAVPRPHRSGGSRRTGWRPRAWAPGSTSAPLSRSGPIRAANSGGYIPGLPRSELITSRSRDSSPYAMPWHTAGTYPRRTRVTNSTNCCADSRTAQHPLGAPVS
ncbi:PleD family two-component system response regulator [Streptomyces kaempferi]